MAFFKLSKTSVAACAALLVYSAPAFSGNLDVVTTEPTAMAPMAVAPQPSGDWYVSVFAGTNLVADVETDYYGSDYNVSFDNGFVAGLTFGKRLSDRLRVEGELSFARNSAETYTYGGGAESPADGDLDATYLLANLWYDIPTSGSIGYYVGGGIGAARVEADTYFNGAPYGYGPGETKLAGQIGAGVIYDISQTLALDVGYRYKYVGDVDFDDSDGSGIYTGGDVQSHILQVGLTYNF